MPDVKIASVAHTALREEFGKATADRYGPDCNLENFPDIGLEDTPHYNKFDDVNVDLRHHDKEWLADGKQMPVWMVRRDLLMAWTTRILSKFKPHLL